MEKFRELINANKSDKEIKDETTKLTKSLLKQTNNLLIDWEGTVIDIDLYT